MIMVKAIKIMPSQFPTNYQDLCQILPPRMIHSRKDYLNVQATIEAIKKLRRLTKDQRAYLELLHLISDHYQSQESTSFVLNPIKLLHQLIHDYGLSKTDLSRILGKSLSLGSMILSGQRKITKEHARRLGRYFDMQPEAFLGQPS